MTAKVAALPFMMIRVCGWVTIVGGRILTVKTAVLLIAVQATLLTITE